MLIKPKIIECECRNDLDFDHSEIQGSLRQLQHVPASIQKRLVDKGLKIIYFTGSIVKNPELRGDQGKRVKGYNDRLPIYDTVPAIYLSSALLKKPKVFLRVSGMDSTLGFLKGAGDSVVLHEIGHAVDHEIGERITIFGKDLPWQEFSQSRDVLKAAKNEPFENPYHRCPKEYVAHAFRKFYESPSSRTSLAKNQPTIHQVFKNLEKLFLA